MRNCPNCNSSRVEYLNRGAKIGAAVGLVVGLSIRGSTAAMGAALGSGFFPVVGTGIGALAGFLLSAIGTSEATSLVGKQLNEHVLDNRKCLKCDYEWHED